MKATEKFFPVVLLIMLHKLVLTFASVFAMEHIDNNKVDANTEGGKPRLFITTENQSLTKGIKRHIQKPRP